MKKIIVISGKQYSGKDTVAKILLDKFKNFKRIGIGDAIKYEYGAQKNLTFEEIEKNKHLYRSDLIALGNEGRTKDPDFWLYKLLEMESDIIVPDIRVEHELEVFKKQNAFLLRVEASYEARSKRGNITNANDITEVALDNYDGWDYVIENNSDYETLLKSSESLIKCIEKFYAQDQV
ncbi:MAG: hypothetical protein E7Z91_01880 [Cyanobacteria bacterium SIG30]|nr:hypothetical protein [Cyanobacteria bacterium SIG30]